ncbi:MAG: hypothetical protein ACYS0I_00300 [Planctomycetota bacterium]|jgi:hypothetical protein
MRKAKSDIQNVPLHVRSIAVSVAVLCFFALGFTCWLSGLAPFTCCKRALTGAVLAYIAAALAVKAINAILINAIIKNQMDKQKEMSSGSRD